MVGEHAARGCVEPEAGALACRDIAQPAPGDQEGLRDDVGRVLWRSGAAQCVAGDRGEVGLVQGSEALLGFVGLGLDGFAPGSATRAAWQIDTGGVRPPLLGTCPASRRGFTKRASTVTVASAAKPLAGRVRRRGSRARCGFGAVSPQLWPFPAVSDRLPVLSGSRMPQWRSPLSQGALHTPRPRSNPRGGTQQARSLSGLFAFRRACGAVVGSAESKVRRGNLPRGLPLSSHVTSVPDCRRPPTSATPRCSRRRVTDSGLFRPWGTPNGKDSG
jgi:hypothetical protein